MVGLQRGGFGTETLEGLRDIGGFDALEVDRGGEEIALSSHGRGVVCIHGGNNTIGHGGDDAVADELLYPTGIAEVLVLRLQGLIDGTAHLLGSLGGEDIVVALEEAHGDLHELDGVVVVELVSVREATVESRVGVQHGFHLEGVAREDDEHIGVGLCEDGEQRVEHATTEVLLVLVADAEVVGLVDEEHIALGFLENSLHVLFRLSDILTYESGTVDGDDLTLGEEAEGVVDPSEFAGDGGLASARVASEDAVVDLFFAVVESPATALLEEARLVGHRLYALLHVVESNHLTQFAHALLEG